MLIWLSAAALAGKWSDAPTDVDVRLVVPARAEDVHALLSDHRGWQQVVPPSCASEWELLSLTFGVGARARTTWTLGPLTRRRTVRIAKEQPGLFLELEHEGNKGWFTQVRYGPAGTGHAEVQLHTPLAAPPWPLRGVFYARVRPAWEACYAGTLRAIADHFTRPSRGLDEPQ